MNIDNIKQVLINKGANVREDMTHPVEIYDGVARPCKARAIKPKMTEHEVAELILQEGTQVAFKGIYSVSMMDPQGNPQGSLLHIRYAAWE